MARSRHLVLVTVSLVALSAGAAKAADLGFGYGDLSGVPQSAVEYGTGWYVRGDIGATRGAGVRAGDEPYDYTPYQAVPGAAAVQAQSATLATTTTTVNPDGSTTTTTTPATAAVAGRAAVAPQYFPSGIFSGPGQTPPALQRSSGSLNYTGSLGAGYQFNRWFRADVVADFHQPIQSSRQGQGVPCVTSTVKAADPTGGAGLYEVPYGTTCTPTLKASLKSYDALVNGYVDLGKWYAVTPYVGAGVGVSFGNASASSSYIQGNGASYNVTYTDALTSTSVNQYWDRSQSKQYYNLAFALMAGFSVDVFDHTKLDIGYRYLHLGSVLGTELATQEVRAGLRYMIDE